MEREVMEREVMKREVMERECDGEGEQKEQPKDFKCNKMTNAEWNDRGCSIENTDGQTVSDLGEIKTMDGWYGQCNVKCPADGIDFVINNTTRCSSILNEIRCDL